MGTLLGMQERRSCASGSNSLWKRPWARIRVVPAALLSLWSPAVPVPCGAAGVTAGHTWVFTDGGGDTGRARAALAQPGPA